MENHVEVDLDKEFSVKKRTLVQQNKDELNGIIVYQEQYILLPMVIIIAKILKRVYDHICPRISFRGEHLPPPWRS